MPPAQESTGRRRFYVLSPCVLCVRDCRVFQSPPGVSPTHRTVGEALSGRGSCAVIPPLMVCGCSEPLLPCGSPSQDRRGGVTQAPCYNDFSAGLHSASVAQEFSELSWCVAHTQNCGVGGEEWALHTMGVAPACQGHTALHFPAQGPPDSCAVEVVAAGGTAQPARRGVAFRVLLVLSPTHRVSGCWGFQTLACSLCAPRCTGPLSAGISGALSPVFSQPPKPLCAAPKAQTWQFEGACPVFSEAGVSAAPAGGRAEGAPQGVGMQRLLTLLWLTEPPAVAVCFCCC